MGERLTRWEGRDPDGSPRAVLVRRDGLFYDCLQPALRKLAQYEDMEELYAHETGQTADGIGHHIHSDPEA